MDMLLGYQEKKLKPYLKMAVQRLQIAGNKKGTACKHQKREIAKLLEDGKEEKARIKVEHVIREDFTMESYELVELLCELLHERVKYMSAQKECPSDLMETVCSLIWCADRVDIVELNQVKKQLSYKFGKEFAKAAEANANGKVNERLLEKLSVQPPSAHLVVAYLKEIAKEYNVDWEPTEIGVTDPNAAVPTPVGFSVPMAPGSEFRSVYQRQEAPQINPASNPYTAMPHPAVPPPPQPDVPPPYQELDKTVTAPAAVPPTATVTAVPAPVAGPSAVAVPHPPIPPPPSHIPEPPPVQAEVRPPESSAPAAAPSAGSSDTAPSFDDLAARFAALKNNEK